ncbi:hypothetical protein Cgig2_004505 [Carnegiea gigantea]|uniref:WPP domain-associated protein n=1 Tax=Carnegiea gigantea TaxID=171969 RepID=A0A9Q1K7N0_9CARY|nr:hypothetical protein Cgig2_004505 [Carnegiea gigantea]
MDELLMGIQSTVKASMAESATMSILHSAMIKAHEKVQSKEGVIERLNEQSKFCELAIMQLEACLKLVEEEAGNYILENKYDRLLPDLTQIKDRLYGRLRETEIALHDKDKELLERRENERRLKQALGAKEKELQSLRKSCKENERKDGGFCELKNSVDQQVLSIKQHLEGERMALTRRLSQGSSASGTLEETEMTEMLDVIKDQSSDVSPVKGNVSNCEHENGDLEMGFDQMGLEIDRLKQTVDTAFGMMQSSISGSDVHPLELQWMRVIENDIQSIIFKEFVVDFDKKSPRKVSNGFLNVEEWLELINEVTLLRNELEGLVCSDDDGRKSGKFEELVIEDDELKKHNKDEDSEEGGASVSKMIETHEKLIRKKSEEINWAKDMEMVREKGPISPRRSKMIMDTLKKSAEKVIKRVDDFLEWKAKLDALPNKNGESHENVPMASKGDIAKTKDGSQTVKKDYDNEMRVIGQQIEGSSFQFSVIEGIYTCFLSGLMQDFVIKLDEYGMKNKIKEGILCLLFEEVVKELKLSIQKNAMNYSNVLCDYELMFHLKEGILEFVLKEMIEYSSKTLISQVDELNSSLCTIVEEMTYSWSQELDNYRLENLIKEDINRCIFLETVKYFRDLIKEHESQIKDKPKIMNGKDSRIQKLDSLSNDIEIEDILMHNSEAKEDSSHLDFFGSEIWEMEMQKVYDGVSDEDEINSNEVQSKLAHALHQLGTSKAMLIELADNEEIIDSENSVHGQMKLQELLSSSEDQSHSFGLADTTEVSDDINDHKIATKAMLKDPKDNEEAMANENSFKGVHDQMKLHDLQSQYEDRSRSFRLENSTEVLETDLPKSEALDSDANDQEIVVNDCDGYPHIEVEHQMKQEFGDENEEQPQSLSQEEKEDVQVNPLYSELVSSLVVLSQAIVNFENTLQEKLNSTDLRLQKANDELRPLLRHISSLKRNESLYKEAFIIRCQNLQKAESEVDILGDQVDALISLVERIYSTLHSYSPVLQHFAGVRSLNQSSDEKVI